MTAGADLIAALTPVAEALDRLGVACQLAGSVASSTHGVARSTLDIDRVADLAESHVEPFVAALQAEYDAGGHHPREARMVRLGRKDIGAAMGRHPRRPPGARRLPGSRVSPPRWTHDLGLDEVLDQALAER